MLTNSAAKGENMPATRDMQLHIPRPNVRIDVAYSSDVYRKIIANVHVIANLPPIAKITTTWFIPVSKASTIKTVTLAEIICVSHHD